MRARFVSATIPRSMAERFAGLAAANATSVAVGGLDSLLLELRVSLTMRLSTAGEISSVAEKVARKVTGANAKNRIRRINKYPFAVSLFAVA